MEELTEEPEIRVPKKALTRQRPASDAELEAILISSMQRHEFCMRAQEAQSAGMLKDDEITLASEVDDARALAETLLGFCKKNRLKPPTQSEINDCKKMWRRKSPAYTEILLTDNKNVPFYIVRVFASVSQNLFKTSHSSGSEKEDVAELVQVYRPHESWLENKSRSFLPKRELFNAATTRSLNRRIKILRIPSPIKGE